MISAMYGDGYDAGIYDNAGCTRHAAAMQHIYYSQHKVGKPKELTVPRTLSSVTSKTFSIKDLFSSCSGGRSKVGLTFPSITVILYSSPRQLNALRQLTRTLLIVLRNNRYEVIKEKESEIVDRAFTRYAAVYVDKKDETHT